MSKLTRFKDLKVGDHFKFPGHPTWGPSFFNVAKKISSRCYVWSGKKAVKATGGSWRMRAGLMKSCVGSLNVAVEPTGRRSALKKRGGRRRGGKMLGRYRRRYRY